VSSGLYFDALAEELAVSEAAAGLADVSSMAKFELRGSEHDLAEIHPSERSLAARRGVRARDAWWCPLSPELLLVLAMPWATATVKQELDELAAGRDVQIADVTAERVAVCLLGPAAREVISRAGVQALPPGTVRAESVEGIPTLVLHEQEQRWLLVAPSPDAAALWHVLSDAGEPFGLAYVGADALQHLVAARDR
jgi:aminomethyltransferase